MALPTLARSSLARARRDLPNRPPSFHRLTHTDLLVALVARVLAKHPRMNASWAGEGVRANADINMGLAMAVDDGAVAPVIHKADQAELGAIAVQRRDLTERARSGKLHPADIAGGTFTISTSGCSVSTRSPRLSFRPRPRFLRWDVSRRGSCHSTAVP